MMTTEQAATCGRQDVAAGLRPHPPVPAEENPDAWWAYFAAFREVLEERAGPGWAPGVR